MSFCSFSKDNLTTGKTVIDNSFFINYLPSAPQDSVKVYLYGLYLCQSNEDVSIKDMADILFLSIADVIDYFKYWEEYGIVSIVTTEPFSVLYTPIADYKNNYKRFKPEKYEDFTKTIQTIITERMITVSEFNEYFQLMENSSLKPEALLMICKYCVDLKGASISYKYIIAVAKDFISRGITTIDLVEKELSCYYDKTREVAEILRTLKSSKKPDYEDIQQYKKWTEKYCFMHEYILSVIKISKCKNIKNLDRFIDELYSNKCFTEEEAKDYFKNKESLFKLTAEINKTLGIYLDILDNAVITYTSPWVAMGYSANTLLFIANYCFRKNRRTLELMDETIQKMYKLGLLNTQSIAEYIKTRQTNDLFILKILDIVGCHRKPTDWDRDNLNLWRSWNFSDEIILEASKRATNVKNHIPYISAILADWKNKGAFTLDEINKISALKKNNEQPKSQHFENERKLSKKELDELVDSFDDFKV